MNQISKADIHIHTRCSNGVATPAEVIDYVVNSTDLNVIAITDHDTVNGGIQAKAYLEKQYGSSLKSKLEVIVGDEVSSAEGHIIGLFLNQDIPPKLTARKTIELIHSQGGVAIAAHPYSYLLKFLGMAGVGKAFLTLPFDGVEILNSAEIFSNFLTKYVNRKYRGLPETGGSDAHYLFMIGKAYTYFKGKTAEDLYRSIRNGETVASGNICNPIRLVKATFFHNTTR